MINVLIVLHQVIYYWQNLSFLVICANDANKRNYMMVMLSNSLEHDFFLKDSITVRLPTINMLST